MPELPEVETIARGLAPGLVGRTIVDARFLCPTVLADCPSGDIFRAQAIGRRIAAVRRRAKLLLVDLDPAPGRVRAAHLAVHLKMTGRLWIGRALDEPPRHVRLIVPLDDGTALFFQDQRRFGTCRLLTDLAAWPFFAALGPEPLEMSFAQFDARLGQRSARIKALLLDQTVIAGIGNIYADESLFLAGIRPDAKARDISPARREKLLAVLRATLVRAIEAGGSTIRDYRTPEGLEGGFQNDFQVYGRGGQPCPRCRTPLSVTRVAGRTSTFCPRCQG
ncbi:bifunctional DNA-formamidopyrimidine glycosylase/DNA-(apurinic or apyrimidinic site) lyase [Desulfolutivibrio sulfoxidireducens]|uniref:bifunctional DNA-formamidopyrimidine glycosylase/DNA-(apurinic or apyrimidinic site) lyase n=1 Tax=Desulfolutivibrio sulfoxidireducens TaxID=2773299 RepID=UPI00159DABC3|nr:bifunctional DNA-formamidopyrimidine glycosylase/DNA-(apurinic or apyrimidinic site) lyase [Desulfolutivibrio sulfoxidireducens]QLA16051.1 bifunctional DNA-formamidopyrimidine glycosylase/DNA-(apurinic or apyrimidinic site) lyase [Desulfolutivibrio sulfoxidireducens]QLA20039.1 bifunctional DNA-formamidopyrimidine glycosylase/DNA-(apurinic or apyrimidinic site) lyase [Desulfolutivibrio sulfoxidireducens]